MTPQLLASIKEIGKEEMKSKKCSTLDELINRAEGLAGPMYTLFASILNMGTNSLSTNDRSLTEAGLEYLIRVVAGIALMLPLFALAVVMVVRAVLLWVIIAFSPALMLYYAYTFKGGE
ncbi:MAG: hypothetical protein H6765_03955 [Candidatus Peribacteria bacterium]|nr:MAG: hypothetical protein H6765_03955 [Candidatus Peribacteria bacterium]